MSFSMILLVVLIVLVIGAVPAWPYNRRWGFLPLGAVGVVLLAVIVLMLTGRI